MTSITSSEVVAAWGAYYLDHGQNMDNLHQRPFESFGTQDAFTIVPTEDTILRESDVTFSEILQQFQIDFTPKGGVTFKPVEIPLYNVKIDASFYPDALKNQWLSFLTSNKLDRTTWPFIRWFIEKYVLGQTDEDMEMKAIYKGVHTPAVALTAGDADKIMNGVRTLINGYIDQALITPITTGAPSMTPATWCEQVEAFCASIPEKYWSMGMQLNMSRALARRYRQGRREKYNINYAQVSELNAVEDFEGITVTGRASMTASTKIWMTPKSNAILGVKGFSNKEAFEVEKVDRKVKLYSDFYVGAGFILKDLIWTNDQDLNE